MLMPDPEQANRPSDGRAAPQAMWKEPVFLAGILVGIGLLLVGMLCASFAPIPPTVSFLVLCSGLGILFGAFGSTASSASGCSGWTAARARMACP